MFRPWEDVTQADLLAREAACLAAMNPFAVLHGCRPFHTLADALKSDVPLLTSFVELDHYPQRVGGRYIGPNHGFTEGEVVDWSGIGKHKIFVYLHHWPELDQLLNRLSRFDVEVIGYCPELTSEQRKALSSKTLNLIERPVQMAHVLKDCDLMITNGGHGLMTACLLFGVTILVIPLYVEQRLMASNAREWALGYCRPIFRRNSNRYWNHC
jgi:UDP:flavonoid glycosyltransferase YjiC (YdhE family)